MSKHIVGNLASMIEYDIDSVMDNILKTAEVNNYTHDETVKLIRAEWKYTTCLYKMFIEAARKEIEKSKSKKYTIEQ